MRNDAGFGQECGKTWQSSSKKSSSKGLKFKRDKQ